MTQHTITADTFTSATKVTIRFTEPTKKKPTTIPKQKMTPKQVVTQPQKTTARPSVTPEAVTQTIAEAIPIISEVKLKGRRIQPEYPKRALRLRQQGVVWIHVLISETGALQRIKLYKPSQYSVLNQAAIKAVKQWTFDPHIVKGRAVQTWVEVPIEFKIQ